MNWALATNVVGAATTSLDYLQSYVTNDSIVNLGNIKEADMEAVMACEPDIIFIGGRLSKSYDALCEIAPVVFLAPTPKRALWESTRENAMTIASIFGLEDHVEGDFDNRIDALKAFARQDCHRRHDHQQLQCSGQRWPLLHHRQGDRL